MFTYFYWLSLGCHHKYAFVPSNYSPLKLPVRCRGALVSENRHQDRGEDGTEFLIICLCREGGIFLFNKKQPTIQKTD